MKHLKKLNQLQRKNENSSRNYSFTWNDGLNHLGSFEINRDNTDKFVKGFIDISGSAVNIEIEKCNYKAEYIKSKILEDLSAMSIPLNDISIRLRSPAVGDTIATREGIDMLQNAQSINLPAGTYYYSLNSDLINCNGWPLYQNFRATFQKQILKRCDPALAPLNYTILKLTAII